MKKIMFNDRYGLTEAVLSGRKTQTRRIVPTDLLNSSDLKENPIVFRDANDDWWDLRKSKYAYQVGEIVAIAQNYKSIVEHLAKKGYDVAKWMDDNHITKNMAGWLNKMFVKASLMIFKIRITNVRVERLQDISDEDCIKELGLDYVPRDMGYGKVQTEWVYQFLWDDKLGLTREYSHRSPKEVFAVMIDKICGGGTFSDNPYVFVYDFELVK